jgi:hypothetical protein
MTKNRMLILKVLSEPIDDVYPPHAASSIFWDLKNDFENGGKYFGIKTLPQMPQIHRTLRELLAGELIVGTRIKMNFDGNRLPFWETRYQLSSDVYKNELQADIRTILRNVRIAKHGNQMFGGVFGMGLPADEVKLMAVTVRSLMQKTHPDKAEGFEAEFIQLKAALDLIKTGIPLPTPTHTAGHKIEMEMTYIS